MQIYQSKDCELQMGCQFVQFVQTLLPTRPPTTRPKESLTHKLSTQKNRLKHLPNISGTFSQESLEKNICFLKIKLPEIVDQPSELRKHGNMGNKFPEPMFVFRNQVIRQGRNFQESVKLLWNNAKNDGI